MRALKAADFTTSTPPQPLGKKEVHLWFFARWPRVRQAAESEFVRALLGSYLRCESAAVRIDRDARGKPAIHGERLCFNLAHSGDALLVGVADALAVGVDLETPSQPRPVLDLARRYFAPAEAQALAALPEDRRQDAFLRLWTCKEAALKAQGQGISGGLASMVFSLDPRQKRPIPRLQSDAAGAGWHVRCAYPAPECFGAVAWMGEDRPIRAFKVIL
jgi:4'-phosphopantetheinyl transferase